MAIEDLPDDAVNKLANNTCPDCGARQLLAGPEGGGSQNLMCGKCYSEFNYAGFFAERIFRSKEDKAAIIQKLPPHVVQPPDTEFEEEAIKFDIKLHRRDKMNIAVAISYMLTGLVYVVLALHTARLHPPHYSRLCTYIICSTMWLVGSTIWFRMARTNK